MVTELTVTGKPIHSAATEDRWCDFSDYLEISGRTLVTPTITEYTLDSAGAATASTDWTISGEDTPSTDLVLTNGRTISGDTYVVFTLTPSSPTSGTNYRFRVSVTTSASETLVGNVDILCSDS